VTVGALVAAAKAAVDQYAMVGLTGRPAFNVNLYRACKGRRARIAPGLVGTVLSWGDGSKAVPTLVSMDAKAVLSWHGRLEKTAGLRRAAGQHVWDKVGDGTHECRTCGAEAAGYFPEDTVPGPCPGPQGDR